MKRLITIIIIFVILLSSNAVMAEGKPLIIKGLYIGMDVNNARNILIKLLGKEWEVSSIGRTSEILPKSFAGESKIFGEKPGETRADSLSDSIGGVTGNLGTTGTGEYGFAIIGYSSYEGFISADKGTSKVVRMSFSGKITDALFSTQNISADEFVTAFDDKYGVPLWQHWIPNGWAYKSSQGYTVTIMTDKFLDIKKGSKVNFE